MEKGCVPGRGHWTKGCLGRSAKVYRRSLIGSLLELLPKLYYYQNQAYMIKPFWPLCFMAFYGQPPGRANRLQQFRRQSAPPPAASPDFTPTRIATGADPHRRSREVWQLTIGTGAVDTKLAMSGRGR